MFPSILKPAPFILLLFLVLSCNSQKLLTSHSSLSIDSTSLSLQTSSLTMLDSLVHSLTLSFDTLQIDIQRPVQDSSTLISAAAPILPIIRLRAVRGTLHSSQTNISSLSETATQRDTTSCRNLSTSTSSTQSNTTGLYQPPSGNLLFSLLIIGCLLLLAAVLFFLLRRYLPRL